MEATRTELSPSVAPFSRRLAQALLQQGYLHSTNENRCMAEVRQAQPESGGDVSRVLQGKVWWQRLNAKHLTAQVCQCKVST